MVLGDLAMVMTTRVLGGRYVLEEVLGTGGMATVWRATDEVLGREVAVKVLSPQYAADPGFMARLEREARHAAQLSHPRLVTVYDCGIDNGTAFIVMELVAGRTLRQVLDEAGILPHRQAVGIAAGVCEALEVAHAARLVHRDIKPANIVVSGTDVKVLDFGIARADDSAGGTPTLGALGTVAYLSPEQASGHAAGPQSDLYSLGCVLFEMLTGEPPFTADSAVGLAYRHVHDDPGPPSARAPGVPAPVDAITTRLMAKDAAARPASAAAARADLLAALSPDATDLLTTTQEDVVPTGPRRRGFRRPTRPETLLGGALAAALAALAAVLLSGTTGLAAPAAAQRVSASGSRHASASPPAAHKAHKPAHLSPAPTPRASLAPTQPASPAHTQPASAAPTPPTAKQATPLPPVAAAAGAFVGDLEAGVTDGQVALPAGQDLYNHLQPLLFGPPDRTPQQLQQQYAQLLQSYDQHLQQGQITGHATTALHRALSALAAAVGAA
jgi:eukaryotic-like serine/threonine-protein kinase